MLLAVVPKLAAQMLRSSIRDDSIHPGRRLLLFARRDPFPVGRIDGGPNLRVRPEGGKLAVGFIDGGKHGRVCGHALAQVLNPEVEALIQPVHRRCRDGLRAAPDRYLDLLLHLQRDDNARDDQDEDHGEVAEQELPDCAHDGNPTA